MAWFSPSASNEGLVVSVSMRWTYDVGVDKEQSCPSYSVVRLCSTAVILWIPRLWAANGSTLNTSPEH